MEKCDASSLLPPKTTDIAQGDTLSVFSHTFSVCNIVECMHLRHVQVLRYENSSCNKDNLKFYFEMMLSRFRGVLESSIEPFQPSLNLGRLDGRSKKNYFCVKKVYG